MYFALKKENFTAAAASLWGDLLNLDRPATYAEALGDFRSGEFSGQYDDYFDCDTYKGPCALGISVEQRDVPADAY